MERNALYLPPGEEDTSRERIENLVQENTTLKQQLAIAKLEIGRAKSDAARSVKALRQQLQPLYTALRQVFGEMDAIAPDTEDLRTMTNSNPKWEMWKQTFPGKGRQIIELLLVQEKMNGRQLCTAIRCDPRTLAQHIYKLTKAGLLQKNGNDYSLKPI